VELGVRTATIEHRALLPPLLLHVIWVSLLPVEVEAVTVEVVPDRDNLEVATPLDRMISKLWLAIDSTIGL
jgi:hypothetical protein